MNCVPTLVLVSLVAVLIVGCNNSPGQDGQPAQQAQADNEADVIDPLLREFPRIEPPAEFPPHPRMYLNQTEIDELKAWIARDAELREYVDGFLADMRKVVAEPELPGDHKKNHDLARQANKLALAYVLTDEVEFAQAAADILTEWIDLFPTYKVAGFKGIATDSTLGEVQWAAAACAAYDLIYNAGVLTDQQKAALEQDVFKVSADVMFDCNHAYRSNWRIAGTGGVGLIGFCIGDRDLIDKALNGARDEEGRLVRDGFVQQMTWSQLADGIYYERSSGYTNICLLFYTWMLEPARHSGLDLWHMEFDTATGHELGRDYEQQFDASGPKTFKNYFDAICYRTFGDVSIAGIGNDHGGKLRRQFYWAPAWRAYGDPKYAWLFRRDLPEGKLVGDPLELMYLTADMPAGEFSLAEDARIGLTGQHTNACTLLPNGGFALLRQDASENAVAVAVTFGDYANAHSHPDQLSICVYADGHLMVPEMKNHSYGHEGHIGWAKQTIAHNTVTVDEISQYPQRDHDDVWVGDTKEKPAHGKLVLFHPGEELKVFRGLTDSVYDGVILDRTIVLVDSVVVDFYRCRSADEHQYDLALHVDGGLAETSMEFGAIEDGPPSDHFGYNNLIDVRRTTVPGEAVTLTYHEPETDTTMHVTLLPNEPLELIAALGFPNKEDHRRPALIARRTGTNVDFVRVMNFDSAGNVKAVERLTDLPEGLMGVRIERTDGQADMVISAEKPGAYTVAGQTFTGQVALIRNVAEVTVLVDVAE